MEKAVEQVFKVFHHLAREIQIYFFSGLLIALNCLLLDYLYFDLSLWDFIQSKSLIWSLLVVIYIFGQFSRAFYYVLLTYMSWDKKINEFLGFKYEIDRKSLPDIYFKDANIYVHFVERHIILYLMRFNLSASCLINVIVNIIFIGLYYFFPVKWQLILVTVIFFIGGILFYILGAKTEYDYARRIDILKNKSFTAT